VKRTLIGYSLALLLFPAALAAQQTFDDLALSPTSFTAGSDLDPMGGDGGGGQVVPSASRGERFSRLTAISNASSLGTGGAIGTNFGHSMDIRGFANFFSFSYDFYQSGFNIALNIQMTNAGAQLDYYPFHRKFRISPGYIFYNTNRVRADLAALPGASFTINGVDWYSDTNNPVTGTGRLLLNGSGFTVTGGYGHIVSRTRKHFTFPFEVGAAFIPAPTAQFFVYGDICTPQQTYCRAASDYPGFASNLAAQIASWNKRLEPFHVYPIIQGGVAYTFRIRK
jgi:hypothetical protein